MKSKDYTGQVFGHWTVLRKLPKGMYECSCGLCGSTKPIYGGNLTRGGTTMCWECSVKMRTGRRKTHGMSKTKLYWVFGNLRHSRRKIVSEWLNDFVKFRDGVLDGYAPGLYLTAVQPELPIGPGNYAWVDKPVCTGRVFVTINGRTQSKAGWARELGISRQAFDQRMKTSDDPAQWSNAKYASMHRKRKSYVNKYAKKYGMSLKTMSTRTGIPYHQLRDSAARGGLKIADNSVWILRHDQWSRMVSLIA